MKTRMIAVGCNLPQGPVEQHPFSFRPNVELSDILIINPNQTPQNYGYQSGTYHGKACLTESLSEQILADKEFWENCILKRLMCGKNVYVFLEKPEQYYIHTGETRRLRNGNRNECFSLVSLFHSYAALPAEVGRPLSTNDLSPQMEVSDPMLRLLASRCGGEMTARAYFPPEEFGGKPGLIHPTSKAVLGGTIEVSNGRVILLPALDLDRPEYLVVHNGRESWSENAKRLIEKFAKTIQEIEATFVPAEIRKEAVVVTRYDLPEDATLAGIDRKVLLHSKISELTEKIEELKRQQEALLSELEIKTRVEQEQNKFIFESGAELEKAVLKALNRLHLDPADNREASIEKAFSADDAAWLFSVVSTDNSAVESEALNGLMQHAQEFFEGDNKGQFPKAVLIANAFRDIDPLNRGEFFSAKCIRLAAHHRIALVRAMDLTPIIEYLKQNPKDLRFAAVCREAIHNAEGKIVKFPSPPAKTKNLRKAQRKSTVLSTTFGQAQLW